MGTPGFMPPELAMSEKNIDGRADLYALGCVAYSLLTGQMLFTADSPMQVLMKHINETPEPPSNRSELTIPAEMDTLVLKCLEKDPAKRPGSARELSSELRRIRVERPWGEAEARQWWEAHRPV